MQRGGGGGGGGGGRGGREGGGGEGGGEEEKEEGGREEEKEEEEGEEEESLVTKALYMYLDSPRKVIRGEEEASLLLTLHTCSCTPQEGEKQGGTETSM